MSGDLYTDPGTVSFTGVEIGRTFIEMPEPGAAPMSAAAVGTLLAVAAARRRARRIC